MLSNYPQACYNPFALSERQNFPPLDEVFCSASECPKSPNSCSSDDWLPQRTYFDTKNSEHDNNIFSHGQRSILETKEDALISANAEWWRVLLSGHADKPEHAPESLPCANGQMAQAVA
eukprot:jgi/Ulvmu1/3169/UM015_0210.1